MVIDLIGDGGGMTAVYGAGVISALIEINNIMPRLRKAYASSGASGTFAFCLAGQHYLKYKIWVESLCSESGFIDRRRIFSGNMLDLDHLEFVFREKVPLDIEALKKSKVELYIAVTDYETGEGKYFTNRDDVDIIKVLKASKAAPVVYNKPIIINGRRYIDGDISSSLEEKIDLALTQGAKKIIAIDNNYNLSKNNQLSRLNYIILTRYSKTMPEKLQKVIYSYLNKPNKQRNDSRVFYIRPSQILPIGMLDNNKEKLKLTKEMGYKDTAENKKLRLFLDS